MTATKGPNGLPFPANVRAIKRELIACTGRPKAARSIRRPPAASPRMLCVLTGIMRDHEIEQPISDLEAGLDADQQRARRNGGYHHAARL
jgi:hypothetical protein